MSIPVFDRVGELSGPNQLLTWLALANVVIFLVLALLIASRRAHLQTLNIIYIKLAIVLIYSRSFYRNIIGSTLTYEGAMTHAIVGAVGLYTIYRILRYKEDRERHVRHHLRTRTASDIHQEDRTETV